MPCAPTPVSFQTVSLSGRLWPAKARFSKLPRSPVRPAIGRRSAPVCARILGCKSDPVAIGSVERCINEYAFTHGVVDATPTTPNGLRAAIIGSGPAGMALSLIHI
jgi:NADPH-dependent glutamate synthase beta subunit-like oxidoreductase